MGLFGGVRNQDSEHRVSKPGVRTSEPRVNQGFEHIYIYIYIFIFVPNSEFELLVELGVQLPSELLNPGLNSALNSSRPDVRTQGSNSYTWSSTQS